MNKKTVLSAALTLSLLLPAGAALAQTPGFSVGVTVPATVSAAPAQTIAILTLTVGASGATLNSLPVALGYSEGVPVNPFNNCMLHNGSSGGTVLNTGTNAIVTQSSGTSTIRFDQALSVAPNGTVMLYLTCDLSPAMPNGSAIAVQVNTQEVLAIGNGVTLSVGGAGTQGGTPGGVATVSSNTPATSDTIVTPVTPGTPGIPNTGAGAAAETWAIVALSALAGLLGLAYMARQMRVS